jgi:hypothetical protein
VLISVPPSEPPNPLEKPHSFMTEPFNTLINPPFSSRGNTQSPELAHLVYWWATIYPDELPHLDHWRATVYSPELPHLVY